MGKRYTELSPVAFQIKYYIVWSHYLLLVSMRMIRVDAVSYVQFLCEYLNLRSSARQLIS